MQPFSKSENLDQGAGRALMKQAFAGMRFTARQTLASYTESANYHGKRTHWFQVTAIGGIIIAILILVANRGFMKSLACECAPALRKDPRKEFGRAVPMVPFRFCSSTPRRHVRILRLRRGKPARVRAAKCRASDPNIFRLACPSIYVRQKPFWLS